MTDMSGISQTTRSPLAKRKKPEHASSSSEVVLEEDTENDDPDDDEPMIIDEEICPMATSDIYLPDHSYVDLGYLAISLQHFGVSEKTWRSRCFSFAFIFKTNDGGSKFNLKTFTSMDQSRLIFCSNDSNASLLLLPPSFSKKSGLPLTISGSLRFAGDSIETVKILRYFATQFLLDGKKEQVPLPPTPKYEFDPIAKHNFFLWRGEKRLFKLLPSMSKILSTAQTLHFVMQSPKHADGCTAEIELTIDAYISDQFFSGYGTTDFSDVSTTHQIKNRQKLNSLLNAGQPNSYKSNPFLETLLVEKGFAPVDTEAGSKVFGDHMNPKVVADLFAYVKAVHADQRTSESRDPQHPNLILKMHDYQKRAVTWMLTKENAFSKNLVLPHPLTYQLETEGGDRLFVQHGTFAMSRVAPIISAARGGILADEMGLGKTLETISLILSNPKGDPRPVVPDVRFSKPDPGEKRMHCYCHPLKSNKVPMIPCAKCGFSFHKECVDFELIPKCQKFLCGTCQRQHRIECKTTLIVAPAAIIPQWKSEIHKSARDISLYHYTGITSFGFFPPWDLAQYDIVLTSYETLAHEILYIHAEDRRASLRQIAGTDRSRSTSPTPLLALKFWRFVLDEAQMVQSQASNYAIMAMKISANFYWAVTGTPIQRDLSDLQGLLAYIEHGPWDHWRWFERYLEAPFHAKIFEPLGDVLADCMWRLEKADVEAELNLPPCSSVVHPVQFSGIEKQLYQQVFRDCVKKVTLCLRGFRSRKEGERDPLDFKYTDLHWSLVKIIKQWLTHLGKICTSPTRVNYFFNVVKKAKASTGEDDGMDSLARVISVLLKKAESALKGSLRDCVGTKNTTAGLYWLTNRHDAAAEEYRLAIRLMMNYEQYIPVNILQKYHTLTNLGELVTSLEGNVPSLPDEASLFENAEDLKQEFGTKNGKQLDSCTASVRTVWENVPHSKLDLEAEFSAISDVLNCVKKHQEAKLVHEVKISTLSGIVNHHGKKNRTLPATYETVDGLRQVLQTRWMEIVGDREVISQGFELLMEKTKRRMEAFLEQCTDCHIRPAFIPTCQLCLLEESLDRYEHLIFRMEAGSSDDLGTASRGRGRKDEETGIDGLKSDGEFELACQASVLFVNENNNEGYSVVYPDLKQFFRTLELMKDECSNWKELCNSLFNYASGCHQLKQAAVRLHFPSPEEVDLLKELTKSEQKTFRDNYRVVDPASNVNDTIKKLTATFRAEEEKLAADCTHFKYIRNMHQGYVMEAEVRARDCCICLDVVGDKWALFPCVHIMCQGCLKALCENTGTTVGCPVCRTVTRLDEIVKPNGIYSGQNAAGTAGQLSRLNASKLNGAPAKMEIVLQTLFSLVEKEADVKVIIFSEYVDVLEDYQRILTYNGFLARLVKSKGDIPTSIQKLREGTARILLLPISLGGKGLTIIEASHLFFLEPLLNKGVELQAIGRIHRMGQTKPTFVHKFIVNETVEQRIHEMLESVGHEGSLLEQDLTLRQILQLLKISGTHGPAFDSLGSWMQHVEEVVDDD